MCELSSPISAQIVVVDPSPGDYAGFLTEIARPGIAVHFVTTGEDALRLSAINADAVWLVNYELPDLPGLDLRRLLVERSSRGSVVVVTDRPNIAEELAVRASGAFYGVKPASSEWFGGEPHRGESSTMFRPRHRTSTPFDPSHPREGP